MKAAVHRPYIPATREQRRKWHLHKIVKRMGATPSTYTKEVFITRETMESLDLFQRSFISELIEKYGYKLQYRHAD